MTNNTTLPRHVVIVPDGNRRWAAERDKEPWDGHMAGAENIKALVRAAYDQSIYCLSFWGSSINNLTKRPLREKEALLSLYKKYFAELRENSDIHKKNVRINIIGRWREHFPKTLVDTLTACQEETKDYDTHILNFFLAYNGDDEMLYAIKGMMDDDLQATDVNDETVKAHLMTKDIPEIDLLIRTGDDPHISTGFCMWDTRNAQLHFAPEMFPDFGVEAFSAVLEEFSQSAQKNGK